MPGVLAARARHGDAEAARGIPDPSRERDGLAVPRPQPVRPSTFEIVAHGATPLRQTTISSAELLADTPPYGSKLVITVPPIPTLAYEPNASFSALSLTIGGTPHARAPIAIPRRCPSAGFAFAASFSFADGTSADESGRLPCP